MATRAGIRLVAETLQPPRAGYLATVERARIAAGADSIEAARQLEVFGHRVAGLSTEELRELHDETFARPPVVAVGALVAQLARPGPHPTEGRAAFDVLTPALERLEADRNPFTYAVRALVCLLLARPQ